jgi:hypothetical protein
MWAAAHATPLPDAAATVGTTYESYEPAAIRRRLPPVPIEPVSEWHGSGSVVEAQARTREADWRADGTREERPRGPKEDGMELMDTVKQVAGEMRETAKKGASRIQAKVEQTQLRRKADEAARRLGYLIHRERTGGGASGAEADALLADITDVEARLAAADTEERPATVSPTTPPAPSPTPPSPPAPSAAMSTPPAEPAPTIKPSESPAASMPAEKRPSRRSSASEGAATPPAPEQAPKEAPGE